MMALLKWALSGKEGHLSLPEQVFTVLSLLTTLVWVFPHPAMAQSTLNQNTPILAFEIKSEKLLDPQSTLIARDIPGNKVSALRFYLQQNRSPLQNHVETLLMQPNWKIIVSISHAESNMCKRQLGNNCWGIGGARYHRFYPTFAEGIVDANNLIQKYHDGGLDTPQKMMRRWVGWNNQSWIRANNQVLVQLETLGI